MRAGIGTYFLCVTSYPICHDLYRYIFYNLSIHNFYQFNMI